MTQPTTGPSGQTANPSAIEHLQRLQRRFYPIEDHAWCLVGNGLSNQTFVEGPDGIIAIDSGESVEEMHQAIVELRHHTQTPIVACIYTHSHYVNGTQAIMQADPGRPVAIYGHQEIEDNLNRYRGELAPKIRRGIAHQFGTLLPSEGPDALLHCGLGRFFRNPDHAPYTPGYVPAEHTLIAPWQTQIAGLSVELIPAPSDASDSITIWFPQLELCVNNLIWPSFFNIYALRGEPFRDPSVLLEGMDRILKLEPRTLIGTHGPPLAAPDCAAPDIQSAVRRYRDSIQFVWDQTIRAINQGLTLPQMMTRIRLPEIYRDGPLTREFYGLVSHHVRQIHGGLVGWFDEDPSQLITPAPDERSRKLIDGFGGHDAVRQQIDQALQQRDTPWAIELATWLQLSGSEEPSDRQRMADGLRQLAGSTTSANVRNWCLTRTLEMEGELNLQRFRTHLFREQDLLEQPPLHSIEILRVLLDAKRAANLDIELAWHFAGDVTVGLHIRHQVAVVTDGARAQHHLFLSHETWASVLAKSMTFDAGIETGVIAFEGDLANLRNTIALFDHVL